MQSYNSYVGLRRVPTSLLLVGGLHLVVVWALINGLHVRLTATAQPTDIVASVINTVKPPPQQIVAPDVPQTYLHIAAEPPVVRELTEINTDDGPTITLPPPGPPEMLDTTPADPRPIITGAAVDPRHPLTQPDYPPLSPPGG